MSVPGFSCLHAFAHTALASTNAFLLLIHSLTDQHRNYFVCNISLTPFILIAVHAHVHVCT